MGIEKINKDILKTLELYSDQSGFNNAAALLADDNQFTGIDIIRFGDTIDEIMDRESLEIFPYFLSWKKHFRCSESIISMKK